MKIVLFTSQDLHGYLSFSIPLKPALTFLTGINGSGKTSAVRAMTALLTPSFNALATMQYAAVSVTVEHEDAQIIISSHRNDDEILLYCTGLIAAEPLRIPILKPDAYESRGRFAERQKDFYREQEAVNSRNPILKAIEDLPTPMFLDLERRNQEGTRTRRDYLRHAPRPTPVNPLAGSLIESLVDAQGLAEATYRQFLASRSHITDSLKQELILAAFRQVENEHQPSFWNERPDFLLNLSSIEDLVIDSLTQIGISKQQIGRTVERFFARVKDVAAKVPPESHLVRSMLTTELAQILQDWSALQPQVQQVHLIANRIARYNTELSRYRSPIDSYLTSINRFFSDSRKRLGFDESGGLYVYVDGEAQGRTLSSLSSGERQLVVILTHLAFNRQAKLANILIIDEPELSLHLRWQELFVDAVVAASPELQVILATHSPSIIKGRVENCIDVEDARHK